MKYLFVLILACAACDGSREQRQIDALKLEIDSLKQETKPVRDSLDPVLDSIESKVERTGKGIKKAFKKLDSTVNERVSQ